MTENERVDVVGVGNALDADALAMWLSIGRSMMLACAAPRTAALSLVPRLALHPRQNGISGTIEGATPKLVRDTIGR